ncbi:MAG: tetratricopeptide repeat protein [Thermoanaerobaculia bacterium]
MIAVRLFALILLAAFGATGATVDPSCSPAARYLAHGDTERALQALAGLSGGSAENLRGLALLVENDAAGALRAFERASGEDPEAVEPRINAAVALLRLDRPADAGAILDDLAGRELSPPLAYSVAYHRALAARMQGRLDEALAWSDRALEADPDSADALLLSGTLLERMGRYERAGRRYKDYLGRHPGSIVAMLRFGVVAHRAGHRELAQKYLREVSLRAPDSREAVEARKFLLMWE